MSNNLENDRSLTSGKMYPIDLAPQKITIVKSVSNSEVKMAHLLTGQPKTSGTSQLISHTGPLSLMRPSTQIISSSAASQPQMIVSGSPMLQVTQIVSQGSQIIGQGPQIISQSQLIGPGGQIVSPATQIISQGSQLSQGNVNQGGIQGNVSSSGPQVINVGGQIVGGTGNLVVSSTVRTLPPSVRVLPPLPHHNSRPALSSVSLSSNIANVGSGMIVSKTITSHVPRGPAAGASLAVPRVAARPITPVSQAVPLSSLGSWSARGVRGAVVYSARGPRAPLPTSAPRAHPPLITVASNVMTSVSLPAPLPAIVTLSSSTVLSSVSSVITGTVRGPSLRAITPNSVQQGPRPLPLLQRNYQPAKVLGVANVNVRTPVGNSAPSQLYYEVPRGAPLPALAAAAPPGPPGPPGNNAAPRAPAPFTLHHNNQVNVVTTARLSTEERSAANAGLPRPTILRKRDADGSPTKNSTPQSQGFAASGWGGVMGVVGAMGAVGAAGSEGGGSTTVSAASSPAPDEDQQMPSPPIEPEISPRKKPRKQMLTNEIRQCDFQSEEPPQKSPPVIPPPKRPQLSTSYVCGWRATALHFARPSDVRRRSPRPRDILAIASQRHVLASAEGWKVHHLTAQMDDLVSLESDVGSQLEGVLRTVEAAGAAHHRAHHALQPHAHALLELLKGNIQRSKIVCEGIQEAREDILRVFTHRTFVSDILSRQADKRCFRKHRSQS